MKSKQKRKQIKYVLKQISNQTCSQKLKQQDAIAFLKNKVDRLQLQNKVLAEQLSAEIKNRQCLTLALTEQKQKCDKFTTIMGKLNMADETSQQTKLESNQRLKYLKRSKSTRKQSFNFQNETEYKKLKEKADTLSSELQFFKAKSYESQQRIKCLFQQLLFSKEHLKRAEKQKNDLQQQMEQGRNQIIQANQLMVRQNSQILRLKFEIERCKQPELGNKLDISVLYPNKQDLEDLKHQLKGIFYLNIKDKELRQSIQKLSIDAVKQIEFAWESLNKEPQ